MTHPTASQGAAVPLYSPTISLPWLWWVQPGGADGCRQISPSPHWAGLFPHPGDQGLILPPLNQPHHPPCSAPASKLRPASSLRVRLGRPGGADWVVLYCVCPPPSPAAG